MCAAHELGAFFSTIFVAPVIALMAMAASRFRDCTLILLASVARVVRVKSLVIIPCSITTTMAPLVFRLPLYTAPRTFYT